jgi:hypothetical protein
MSAARARRLVAVAAVAAALGACSRQTPAVSGCQNDDQCGGDLACIAGACLPRAAAPTTWDIELAPKTDSAAAFTELHAVSLPATAFDLAATSKVTLTGTLVYDASATPVTTAHVVLSVPAAITGRPDLQFETDLEPMTTPPAFKLSIPAGVVGRAGTLRVLPTAPDNVTHATSTFSVTVAATLSLPISSKPVTVRGRLLSALGDPLKGLYARAFQAGNLVSNVVQTGDDGSFTLIVPVGGADAVNAQALAVELEPATSDAPAPNFWAKPFALTANVDLGDVHLPAYSQPNAFHFVFNGDANDGPGVTGALVRARTLLSEDATGTTDFLRDGLTDTTGQVSLDLLPGSTAASRLYDIAVVPPADALYATTCIEKFPLVTGGLPPVVVLDKRIIVSGSLVGDDGTPVAGAVVVATQTARARASACDAFASTPPVTTTSQADGTFTVHLDAGTYTFDFDPPSGAPYPRLTQAGVVVTSAAVASLRDDVRLPPGAVLEGTLHDAAGQPLPLAGVRFYAPACAAPMTCPGAAPVLEAQARADGSGYYRVVIPVTSAASGPP